MMTTPIGHPVADSRRGMASPRPKGRENLKSTPCRNIGIYGFCKYEKDGCAYNHDASTKPRSGQSAASDSGTAASRFNVDSPSFTPLQPHVNGLNRAAAISPQSANAAPFTPKSSNSPLVSHVKPKPTAMEWVPQDFQEFVPQSFDTGQHLMPNETQSTNAQGGSFDTFHLHSALQSLTSTPQPQINNPYLQDPSGLSNAAYFQGAANFTQPLQYHLYAPQAPHRDNLSTYQRTTQDFFLPEDVRREYQRRNEATLQVLPNTAVLPHLDHFHSLVPLDTNNQRNTAIFGYTTWIYKATSSKDGKTYALRRIEGYRLTNESAIRALSPWKRLINSSMVAVHDVFTTRVFGDSSLIFVMDFHPCATTIAEHHFSQRTQTDRFGNPIRATNNPPLVPENVLWQYMVQISSALKTIHSNNLAAEAIHPTKILITSKNRLRLNACGILDVVKFDAAQTGTPRNIKAEQLEDLAQLGRLMLSLATSNLNAYTNPTKSLEALGRNYSPRFRDCVTWLIAVPQPEQQKTIDVLLSELSGHVATALDSALSESDAFGSTLATSLEDGRIARLLLKINLILERPDHEHSHSWSDTGERYYIKLFRDYVFHAVDASGRPNTDLSHILGCLNRLDAGSNEAVQLTSRDGDTAFIVTYKEVKRAIESAFGELNAAASGKGRK